MDQFEARQRIEEYLTEGVRFEEYERTVEVAEFARKILTGKEQGDLLHRFKPRENEEQVEQRSELYNPLTPFAANQVKSIFNQVQRTDDVREVVVHNDKKKLEILLSKMNDFFASASVRRFLDENMEFYNFVDPNAWLLIEFEEIYSAERVLHDVRPYPIVILSEDVIDFDVKHGISTSLLFSSFRTEDVGEDAVDLETVNAYGIGFCVKYREIKEGEQSEFGTELFTFQDDDGNSRTFQILEYSNGTKELPAIRFGSFADIETNKKTFVTPLEPAIFIFSDLIQLKSEFDLTKALHTFPQKMAYAPACEVCDGEGENEDGVCSSCKGTGVEIHTSVQDVILLKMPQSRDRFLPLNELVSYVNLPQWLPQWQFEQIDKIIQRVGEAIFNTDIFKARFHNTATAATFEHDKVYDVLSKYAEKFSLAYEKIFRVSAAYLELEDLTVIFRFPSDYKLKTVNELMSEYQLAKNSGVSQVILNFIEMNIAGKLFSNSPEQMKRYKAQAKFKPFSDKPTNEIFMILQSRAEDDFDRLLFENFSAVFERIDEKNPDFYNMNSDAQRKILKATVEQIASEIKRPEQVNFDFLNIPADES